MGISNSKCDRCEKESNMFRMSFFNKDECCENCLLIEQLHDEYKAAKRKEHEECLKGNYDYKGVGLPINYNNWRKCFEYNFDFKALIYQGEQSIENCYCYVTTKDFSSYLCLNDFEVNDCTPNLEGMQIKEIKSLSQLYNFISSIGLDCNEEAEDAIKKFIISNNMKF